MALVKEKKAEDHVKSDQKGALPDFDVTSGGYLHISPEDLLKSDAAQRQIDAVEQLSKQKGNKK